MDNYKAEQAMIKAVIAKYPATFGLQGYRGDSFKINPHDSYVNDTCLQVVLQRLEGGKWNYFIRTTEAELEAEMIKG